MGAFHTFSMTGLCCEPVAQADGCEGVRPCLRPWAAGEGHNGAEARPPVTETSRERIFSPLMAGVVLLDSTPKPNHMASIDPKGRGEVANSPGYRAGIR